MMSVPVLAAMTGVDWGVLTAYFALLVGSGIWFSRRETKDTEDYFLGGRKMPAWAVAVSIVATSMSAASFVGVPESSYAGNLTYLATNIGMVLAAVVVAFVFIPAFYRQRVQTIYGLLEVRYGTRAKQAASIAFMLGRVLASGARIYIGAIPASLVLFGVENGLEPLNLLLAIGVLTVVGVCYTLIGGVASVIWSDVVQMVVLLGACVGAIALILMRLEVPFGDVWETLRVGTPADSGSADIPIGGNKLKLLDWRLDPSLPFTVLTSVVGFTLMGIGSYGTDQDLAQRMLTCKNEKEGAKSMLAGILMGIPSVALFLVVGLLLWVFYQRPEMFGAAAPTAELEDGRQVFLQFILQEMPAGLTGLMMAGLFAAGLSSLNSAINAMSSAFVTDIYRYVRPDETERHYLKVGRIGVIGWGLILGGFACVCVFWQLAMVGDVTGGTLLVFALTVMTFAYAGLIGVFLSVLLTKRGSGQSAIAALVVGFVAVLLLQKFFWGVFVDPDVGVVDWVTDLAFPWKLLIGSAASFGVCQLASGAPQPLPSPVKDAEDAAEAAPAAAK